ncbi:hypothetical protein [Flagellimonas nanhaiensis]|uniref:Uncharacterized protein n=1 Tax=Flagellimonas nanhaiensis TaxID=2292706 RepID=A0A371JN87_9FLAO|nr:hypothetical protein [Allomuricauda nanhaiensis]RDY58640.1 hypothetical protein DX873_13180 [Allomuricauda nanhaiensis]
MKRIRDLVVFEQLLVAHVVVEPKRVKATYTLTKMDGSTTSTDLIYSYDRTYFNKKETQDVNLASMMVAQVALNYGLFCRTIVFDGLFDTADQRFLLDMMENTSREILINKFHAKNEFLKDPYNVLVPENLKHYTAAKVLFENSKFSDMRLYPVCEAPHENEYAILSSGGKDSLLTYGLIKELGVPHPVFINESGRHWFTAINAYKYFRENEPNTAKPWCNSDRVFNWMVRQMPFIRDNFQNIRADIYPIRLWTVGVFLFGVLPIARKRKLGNILIGNEFDTTMRSTFEGITHYQALYDQSKYFDNALTRYYQKKGWNIKQYSLLRSLSELLILKILVKRYPDLQKTQVSCHAAHESGGSMRPCGKCEKCRRIVGMLTALGEDPKCCGYTTEQIGSALENLAKKNVKQIGSDAAHLFHLLTEQGHIAKNAYTKRLARSYPRIMHLRFDNERSKMEDLPFHIRMPLFSILTEYADGISTQRDRVWQDSYYGDLSFDTPYKPLQKTLI